MSVVIHRVGLNKTTGHKSKDYFTTDLVGDFDPTAGIQTEYWDNQVDGGANLRRFNSIATAGTTPKYWDFDGTDDYLGEADTNYGGAPFQLNVANDFTLSAWAKGTTSNSFVTKVFNLGDASSGGLSLKGQTNAGGEGNLYLLANGSNVQYTSSSISWGNWNYTAVVKKSTTFSIFLNGSFLATDTITGVTGTLSVEVGRENQGGSYSYMPDDGKVGIVLIYDNDITSSQLRQNYLATHDIHNTRIYG
jgi:hypothetical protein